MKLPLITVIIIIAFQNLVSAEPFIVLKFNNDSSWSAGDGSNEYSINPNHHEIYKVKSGDSLNSIIKNSYSGSGLDHRFVQLAIVILNPSTFAKNNPNFLFSDKNLYLPGANAIKNLLMGIKVQTTNDELNSGSNTKSIYFFGG
jgi:Tfp pilus assembly protein FimV